ncbi:hydrogen peroxide-dependent heme synthase [Corynebacterium choanae]|uniref:Coproheme decarboxylase n=1 Tax=Corynebacterium choanae TaxID=1862358 RepID=A0A3G6J7C9_9CORY|nr:hydrogen peroxide-dependent heme synthase [Corynebacterium choanae]AZA13722.1 hypothetical protein CCHOA_06650 [Corynebacterium choanae]
MAQTPKLKFDALNALRRYTQWISFSVDADKLRSLDVDAAIAEAREFFDSFDKVDTSTIDEATGTPKLPEGTVVRGVYDVSSLRPEANFMIWWHAQEMETIQESFHQFKNTALGRCSTVFWSGTGHHEPSEFNKSHLPTFIKGEDGRDWVSVYPFVRSYDWYLLDANDRRRILLEHGSAGRKYPDVLPNTVSAFSLGDYEWMLAFECDDLHQIVELMHQMRYTDARLHVREEIPFHTGRRVDPGELVARLAGK